MRLYLKLLHSLMLAPIIYLEGQIIGRDYNDLRLKSYLPKTSRNPPETKFYSPETKFYSFETNQDFRPGMSPCHSRVLWIDLHFPPIPFLGKGRF
jgi:hypothetical protein